MHAAADPWNVALATLPLTFSLSWLLSSGWLSFETPFVDGRSQATHPTKLICLVLNEAAHTLRRGFFEYLPLQDSPKFGHPCDLVFSNKEWTSEELEAWTHASWQQRLSMCAAAVRVKNEASIGTQVLKQCEPSTKVIPISFQSMSTLISRSDSGFGEVESSDSSLDTPTCPTFTYTRTLDDHSTWLIVVDSSVRDILSCPLEAVEQAVECTTEVNTNMTQLSIIGMQDPRLANELEWASNRECIVSGLLQNFNDVVLNLLKATEEEDKGLLGHDAAWGDIRRSWGELWLIAMENQRRLWERRP